MVLFLLYAPAGPAFQTLSPLQLLPCLDHIGASITSNLISWFPPFNFLLVHFLDRFVSDLFSFLFWWALGRSWHQFAQNTMSSQFPQSKSQKPLWWPVAPGLLSQILHLPGSPRWLQSRCSGFLAVHPTCRSHFYFLEAFPQNQPPSPDNPVSTSWTPLLRTHLVGEASMTTLFNSAPSLPFIFHFPNPTWSALPFYLFQWHWPLSVS